MLLLLSSVPNVPTPRSSLARAPRGGGTLAVVLTPLDSTDDCPPIRHGPTAGEGERLRFSLPRVVRRLTTHPARHDTRGWWEEGGPYSPTIGPKETFNAPIPAKSRTQTWGIFAWLSCEISGKCLPQTSIHTWVALERVTPPRSVPERSLSQDA